MILYTIISWSGSKKKASMRKSFKSLGITNYVFVTASRNIKKSRMYGKHHLKVRAGDKYCDLPEKMYEMFKYIYSEMPEVTRVIKIDDDVQLHQDISKFYNRKNDFIGIVPIDINTQNGTWHLGRCEENNKRNKIKFDIVRWNKDNLKLNAKSIIYPGGGDTYSVSRKAMGKIANTKIDPKTHVYEDVMIASILRKHRIKLHVPKCVQMISLHESMCGKERLLTSDVF